MGEPDRDRSPGAAWPFRRWALLAASLFLGAGMVGVRLWGAVGVLLLPVLAVVAVGVATGIACLRGGARLCGLAGTLSWAPLAVGHTVSPWVSGDTWAPTMVGDVVGALATLVLSAAAAAGAIRMARGARRHPHLALREAVARIGTIALPLLIAAAVALWPLRSSGLTGWQLAVDSADPFEVTVSFDADSGTISADAGSVLGDGSFDPRRRFTVAGETGDGTVTVGLTGAGAGIDLTFPPHTPVDSGGAGPVLSVDLALAPSDDGPGVIGRLSVTNRSATVAATVARLGIEDTSAGPVRMAPSGRPDSCDLLSTSLPFVVDAMATATCTFDLADAADGEYIGVTTTLEEPDVTVSSDPARIPPEPGGAAGDPYPTAPEALSPVDADVGYGIARIATGTRGQIVLTVAAPAGSRGTVIDVTAERSTVSIPSSRSPLAPVAAITWVAAAVLVLIHRRAGGMALVAAAVLIPVLMLTTTDHAWYWAGPFVVVAPATALTGGIGAAMAFGSDGGSRRQPGAVLATVLLAAGILAFISVVSAVAASGYVRPDPTVSPPYQGDYMGLMFHLVATALAVAAAVTAGSLWGSTTADQKGST